MDNRRAHRVRCALYISGLRCGGFLARCSLVLGMFLPFGRLFLAGRLFFRRRLEGRLGLPRLLLGRFFGQLQIDAFQVQLLQIQVLVGARVDLAQAQPDAALFRVDADDPQGDHIPFMEFFFGMLDARLADLGNMDESFQIAFQASKCTELGQTGDDPFNQLTDLKFLNLSLPRVVGEGTDRETDALLLVVNADDLDFDFLTDFEHLGGVLDAVPGYFGKVHEAIRPVDIDKGTEIGQAGYPPGADLAFVQFLNHALLDRLACLAGSSPFREDQAAAFAVHFDDADGDRLADHFAVALVWGFSGHLHAAG